MPPAARTPLRLQISRKSASLHPDDGEAHARELQSRRDVALQLEEKLESPSVPGSVVKPNKEYCGQRKLIKYCEAAVRVLGSKYILLG